MRIIWFISGVLAIILGTAGVFLPLLPTVPFLLLAAFCFSRSSPKAHSWLINHKTLGPPITEWEKNGAIRPKIKRIATLFILLGFLLSLYLDVKIWVLALQFCILAGVTIFIWTRPNA